MPFTRYLLALCLTAWPQMADAELKLTIYPSGYTTTIDHPLEAEKKIRATPGNARVAGEKAWSNQRAATVKDLTDYMPGVIAQPRNGAESMRLSVRGSGLASIFQGRGLMVLQDGIPINRADGGFEFPVIDPWLIRYAELYPGANALEYGASNFGGAINLITPTGAAPGEYPFRAEAGSFNTLHGLASYGKAWQQGDLFAAATGFSQDGFREQNRQQTSRLNANIGWQPRLDFNNRFYLSHTHSDAEIPGTLSHAEIRRDPRQANPANRNGHYQRNLDITRIAHKAAWAEENNRVDTALFYTYRTLDNPVTTYEFEHSNDIGATAHYSHRYGNSEWRIGMNHYYGTADETRYRNLQGKPGALILTRRFHATTSEAYTQLDQHLTAKLFGIAALQAAYVTRDIHQSFPLSAAQDTDYQGLSPRLGLRYDVNRSNQIFANLSRSFDPPGGDELSRGNTPGFNQLNAERATTAEIGTRAAFAGFHWQAAYYHGWLKGEFVNYRFPDGSTDTINADKTKRDGIELSLSGKLAKQLSFRTAYTYNRFTLDDDALYGNNRIPGVPRHYLRSELLYHPTSDISLGPNTEWSPTASPIDLTNTLNAPAYAIFGFRAFWENNRMNAYMDGRNLLDKRYTATYNVVPNAAGTDGRYFYPGEGRAVYVGVGWRL